MRADGNDSRFSLRVSPNGNGNGNNDLYHEPRFHSLGWIEYTGRQAHKYYVHPTKRLVVDVDLHNEEVLESYLSEERERESDLQTGRNEEVWIAGHASVTKRRAGKGKGRDMDWTVARVNHNARTLSYCGPSHVQWVPTNSGPRKGKFVVSHAHKQDAVESELRYWKWTADHPAHVQLPRGAREEAIEALGWALSGWSDFLYPFHPISRHSLDHLISPSSNETTFTAKQASDLLAFLQSTSPALDNEAIYTRTIAAIHVQLLEKSRGSQSPRTPWGIGKILVCMACLGTPLLLVPRRPGPTSTYGDPERGHGYNGYAHARRILLTNLCTCVFVSVFKRSLCHC